MRSLGIIIYNIMRVIVTIINFMSTKIVNIANESVVLTQNLHV